MRPPKYELPEPVVNILDALKQSLAGNKAAPKQAASKGRKHKAA